MQIEALAHRNLCDFTRFFHRLESDHPLLDEGGVVAFAGPVDFPTARTALRSEPGGSARDFADATDAFFGPRGKSTCVMARVGADDDITAELTARGYRDWSTTPEMVCEARLEDRDPPPGVTLRFASTPADVADYAAIAGAAFTHLQVPAEVTSNAIDNPDVMLTSDCVIALADIEGKPVAGALVVLFGPEPIGYVGWVAVADEARGRGLGDAVTRVVTNEAFDRGAQLVTLEASQFGESTYARMGYREIYRYRILIRIR